MTDRFSGLIVVLEQDIREDDAEPLIHAIAQLRGVLEVRPVTSRPGLEYTLKQRIKRNVRDSVLETLGREETE